MSELTVSVLRLAILGLLWAFIFSVVGALKSDLYGARVVARGARRGEPAPARPQRAQRRGGPTHLAIIDGPMRGVTVPLTDQGVLIGRNPECSLVVSDDFASGRHARLYVDGDHWFIDDLGSTNGTFVGHQRIGEHTPVQEGSRIRIGTTVLEVRK